MDTTLNNSQVTRLAKSVTAASLQSFYANPKNAAAFQEWLKKKNGKGKER